MNHRILLAALALTACGSENVYSVGYSVEVVSEDEVPIVLLPSSLCPTLTFEDGSTEDDSCDEGTTDLQGLRGGSAFATSLLALTDATAQLEVGETRFDGDVLSLDRSPDPDIFQGESIEVAMRFVTPRDALPEIPYTIAMYGFVQRGADFVVDKTGQVKVQLSFDGFETVYLEGEAPVTTDSEGRYEVDVPMLPHFEIAGSGAQYKTLIDIDGYQSEGELLSVERSADDPRTMDVWSMF